jgi:hypothetical protein
MCGAGEDKGEAGREGMLLQCSHHTKWAWHQLCVQATGVYLHMKQRSPHHLLTNTRAAT